MRKRTIFAGALYAGLLAACPGPQPKPNPNPPAGGAATATAAIEGRSNSPLAGTATFTQSGNTVAVKVSVQNAPPGDHGVHIHEKGDCSDPEAKSAGGHFNPRNVAHGGPGAPLHHPGDFGNITVGPDGTGTLELNTDQLTVGPSEVSVVGRAIVVHEKADDLTTQPTGAAGGRFGCGVIKANAQ